MLNRSGGREADTLDILDSLISQMLSGDDGVQ